VRRQCLVVLCAHVLFAVLQAVRIPFESQIKDDHPTQISKQFEALQKGKAKKRKLSVAENSLAMLGTPPAKELPYNGGVDDSNPIKSTTRRRNGQLSVSGTSSSGQIDHVLMSGSVELLENNSLLQVAEKDLSNSNRGKRRKPVRPRDEQGAVAEDVDSLLSPSLRSYLQEIRVGRNGDMEDICSVSTSRSRNLVSAEDDVCFVCKDGGKLVLCDYPGCSRTYHQVSRFCLLYCWIGNVAGRCAW
jgi:hypothetical protein